MREDLSHRKHLDPDTCARTIGEIERKWRWRLDQKGPHSMGSSHEILGIVTEEYWELIEKVKENAHDEDLVQELLDIAIACMFGVASIRVRGTDW